MKKVKSLESIVFFLVLLGLLFSQDLQGLNSSQSPTGDGITKMDYYSGTANINIPLVNVQLLKKTKKRIVDFAYIMFKNNIKYEYDKWIEIIKLCYNNIRLF